MRNINIPEDENQTVPELDFDWEEEVERAKLEDFEFHQRVIDKKFMASAFREVGIKFLVLSALFIPLAFLLLFTTYGWILIYLTVPLFVPFVICLYIYKYLSNRS